jgi:hypothetical protein
VQHNHSKQVLGNQGRYTPQGFEFAPSAVDVIIFNNRGRAIWAKRRNQSEDIIRWNASDVSGHVIEIGDYVCRIVHADGQIAYMPFILLR